MVNILNIYRLPALSDNYIFLLHDPKTNTAAVVDPAQAKPVLDKLNQLKAKLVKIFNTHHHLDHVGGNQELVEHFQDVTVYGGKQDQGRIPAQQVFLQAGDQVKFGDRQAEVLFVPGHTRAHIAYYFSPTGSETTGELFCGDTLFAGGCGRLFEGTPAQMIHSLGQIRNLPDQTRVWCAHEYTLNNLRFALEVDSDNHLLQQRYDQVKSQRQQNQPTVPSLLEIEKQTNPFLRWDSDSLKKVARVENPVRVFACIRGMKDRF